MPDQVDVPIQGQRTPEVMETELCQAFSSQTTAACSRLCLVSTRLQQVWSTSNGATSSNLGCLTISCSDRLQDGHLVAEKDYQYDVADHGVHPNLVVL